MRLNRTGIATGSRQSLLRLVIETGVYLVDFTNQRAQHTVITARYTSTTHNMYYVY